MKTELTNKLNAEYYRSRDALTAARELLGCILVTEKDGHLTAGVINETEAYMGRTDRASHAFGGRRTNRTETMYACGGCAYVYLIYGMYCCMNVVVNRRDIPEAVLIRSVRPLLGEDIMATRRKRSIGDAHLSDGPGKLCEALGIDRSCDSLSLDGERIYICDAPSRPEKIFSGERINIAYAGEDAHKPWRFWF